MPFDGLIATNACSHVAAAEHGSAALEAPPALLTSAGRCFEPRAELGSAITIIGAGALALAADAHRIWRRCQVYTPPAEVLHAVREAHERQQ